MNTGSGPNRIFDEFAKLMTDAAGVAQGVRGEAETAIKSQAERMLNGLDLVKRDEFEAAQAMAVLAREENDKLSALVEKLEKRISDLEGGKVSPKKSVAKTASKTTKKATGRSASKKSTAKKA